jgi:hypothetical protein
METTRVQAHCHCKHFTLELSIPSTAFPLSSAFCSCSLCRHATGQLAASFATIPRDTDTAGIDVSDLSHYATSGHRTRYFCPRCGANVMDFDKCDGMWRFCTGIMAKTEGLLKRDQIYIGDTEDGGLGLWLEGVGTKFWVDSGSEVIQSDHRILQSASSTSALPLDALLKARCQCGDVEFSIKAPSNGERYTAGIDACSSCRLTTGFELTAWTSIPLDKVQMPDKAPLDLSMRALKKYESSPGVYRYFCGKCGAAIFVGKHNQDWIDIAAGLLRAEEGARAERWLDWKELGFPDEATDQKLVKMLRDGMKASGALQRSE